MNRAPEQTHHPQRGPVFIHTPQTAEAARFPAASANGGVASASSTYSANYPAASAINGDRKGIGWGTGGNVSTNNLVWRQFNFAPITTDKIRVVVNGAFANYARIVEVEAWGTAAGSGGGGGGGGNPPAAGIYFIEADHLETPRLISNAQQQVVWRWDQAEPFGDTPPNENPSNLGTFEFNPRFPGQYRDRETNLSYNYFRDYDSNLGRYVQSDPIGLAGGINTYTYVGGNPLSYVDPYGLSRCSCIAVEGTKDADKNPTWYGNRRSVTCTYKCTRSDGSTENVRGTHSEWYIGDADNGMPGNCLGQQYKPGT